jgi:hypothetical protein
MHPANAVAARLLLVAARADLARYAYLKLVLDSSTIDVVLDRRLGERRWRQKRVAAERRLGDRRHQDLTEDLQRSGWAMVSRDRGSGSTAPRRRATGWMALLLVGGLALMTLVQPGQHGATPRFLEEEDFWDGYQWRVSDAAWRREHPGAAQMLDQFEREIREKRHLLEGCGGDCP